MGLPGTSASDRRLKAILCQRRLRDGSLHPGRRFVGPHARQSQLFQISATRARDDCRRQWVPGHPPLALRRHRGEVQDAYG